MPTEVRIPLVNPNEPEALLAAVHVTPGQHVQAGDVLCTLETTKSAADLTAETEGFVSGLALAQGQTVRAGDLFCYLAPNADWVPEQDSDPANAPASSASVSSAIPPGLRITHPALELARQHFLDLTRLPTGLLVTESAIRQLLEQAPAQELSAPISPFDPLALIIYGAGGHGKIVLDLLRALAAYHVLGFIDDERAAGEIIMGAPILGGKEILPDLHLQGVRLAVNAVGGIGNITPRIKVSRLLAEAGFAFPAVVHPQAIVEPSASLSAGAQVLARAYVGSEASVGFGCIVSIASVVSHDCQLGSYVNISPGALVAGNVRLGERALVGMGATINLGVTIGPGARIGNGATVKSDVPAGGVVRAGAVWPE